MIGSIKNWPSIVLCCLGGVRGTEQLFRRPTRDLHGDDQTDWRSENTT